MFGRSKTQVVQLSDLGNFMKDIMSQQHNPGTTITIYINELHIHQAAGQPTFPALEMVQRRAELPAPASYPAYAQPGYNAAYDPFESVPAQSCAYCGQGVYQGKSYQGRTYHHECLSMLLERSRSTNGY